MVVVVVVVVGLQLELFSIIWRMASLSAWTLLSADLIETCDNAFQTVSTPPVVSAIPNAHLSLGGMMIFTSTFALTAVKISNTHLLQPSPTRQPL